MGFACRSLLHVVRNIDTRTTLVPRYEPEAIYNPILSHTVIQIYNTFTRGTILAVLNWTENR